MVDVTREDIIQGVKAKMGKSAVGISDDDIVSGFLAAKPDFKLKDDRSFLDKVKGAYTPENRKKAITALEMGAALVPGMGGIAMGVGEAGKKYIDTGSFSDAAKEGLISGAEGQVLGSYGRGLAASAGTMGVSDTIRHLVKGDSLGDSLVEGGKTGVLGGVLGAGLHVGIGAAKQGMKLSKKAFEYMPPEAKKAISNMVESSGKIVYSKLPDFVKNEVKKALDKEVQSAWRANQPEWGREHFSEVEARGAQKMQTPGALERGAGNTYANSGMAKEARAKEGINDITTAAKEEEKLHNQFMRQQDILEADSKAQADQIKSKYDNQINQHEADFKKKVDSVNKSASNVDNKAKALADITVAHARKGLDVAHTALKDEAKQVTGILQSTNGVNIRDEVENIAKLIPRDAGAKNTMGLAKELDVRGTNEIPFSEAKGIAKGDGDSSDFLDTINSLKSDPEAFTDLNADKALKVFKIMQRYAYTGLKEKFGLNKNELQPVMDGVAGLKDKIAQSIPDEAERKLFENHASKWSKYYQLEGATIQPNNVLRAGKGEVRAIGTDLADRAKNKLAKSQSLNEARDAFKIASDDYAKTQMHINNLDEMGHPEIADSIRQSYKSMQKHFVTAQSLADAAKTLKITAAKESPELVQLLNAKERELAQVAIKPNVSPEESKMFGLENMEIMSPADKARYNMIRSKNKQENEATIQQWLDTVPKKVDKDTNEIINGASLFAAAFAPGSTLFHRAFARKVVSMAFLGELIPSMAHVVQKTLKRERQTWINNATSRRMRNLGVAFIDHALEKYNNRDNYVEQPEYGLQEGDMMELRNE